MAGIEKICEYSGEYPGHLMYGYKRNHIQIIPKYRKEFRKANAVLVINEKTPIVIGPYGYSYPADKEHTDQLLSVKGNRKGTQYMYTLLVLDEDLQGDVKGKYVNWTTNLRQTVKRLKRMLRLRELKVTSNKDLLNW